MQSEWRQKTRTWNVNSIHTSKQRSNLHSFLFLGGLDSQAEPLGVELSYYCDVFEP